MSSSESDDIDGFESAEEDLHLSDFEDDVVDRRPSPSNEDTEYKESSSNVEAVTDIRGNGRSESPVKQDNVLLGQHIEELSDNVDADIAPNSAESKQLLVAPVKSFHDSNLKDCENAPSCESDKSLSENASQLQDWSNVENCLKLIEAVTIKDDDFTDGWDFEDEDIELPQENPSTLLSSFVQSSHLKEKNTGFVPLKSDLGGLDCDPSGWDFEDDFDYPDSPSKDLKGTGQEDDDHTKYEFSKSDAQNTAVSDNSVWSSWGGWGVTNLIGTAGVSTLTHVTSGLSSMLENTLGAPDPEVLASQLSAKAEEEEPTEGGSKQPDHSDLTADLFGFGNIIGGVKTLGNKVIDGGLETLETLGKKTMEVLQEGDPGLMKKRALLFQNDKVILSQVLRDAKEKAEASEKEPQKVCRKAQYETLFDDFHGLVHLEALEMISRQCEIKMQTVLSNSPKCSLDEFNEAVNLVKHLYEEEDSINEFEYAEEDTKPSNEDLEDVLISCMDALSLNVNIKHFLEVDSAIQDRLKLMYEDPSEMHTIAISDLAQFTACSIELFHRIAELFIVKDIKDIDIDFKALSRVARASKCKIGKISESYCAKLILLPEKSTSPLITNIFLEASNSSTYLDNAFELFAPILQSKALHNEISRN